jgi:hypothetical protein
MTTYSYQGGGYLPGIPARDLTERDVARLTDEQIESLKTKGTDGKQLYTVKSSGDAAKKPVKTDAKPDA